MIYLVAGNAVKFVLNLQNIIRIKFTCDYKNYFSENCCIAIYITIFDLYNNFKRFYIIMPVQKLDYFRRFCRKIVLSYIPLLFNILYIIFVGIWNFWLSLAEIQLPFDLSTVQIQWWLNCQMDPNRRLCYLSLHVIYTKIKLKFTSYLILYWKCLKQWATLIHTMRHKSNTWSPSNAVLQWSKTPCNTSTLVLANKTILVRNFLPVDFMSGDMRANVTSLHVVWRHITWLMDYLVCIM